MSFLSRMTTETGAPMPRWLYLLDKAAHTALIATALLALTPASPIVATITAVLLYVGAGLLSWDLHHDEPWFGPGSYTGDALYHLLPSLVPAALLVPPNLPIRLASLAAIALVWWTLDTAGYGPMRAP